jgi:hypothetical protein
MDRSYLKLARSDISHQASSYSVVYIYHLFLGALLRPDDGLVGRNMSSSSQYISVSENPIKFVAADSDLVLICLLTQRNGNQLSISYEMLE